MSDQHYQPYDTAGNRYGEAVSPNHDKATECHHDAFDCLNEMHTCESCSSYLGRCNKTHTTELPTHSGESSTGEVQPEGEEPGIDAGSYDPSLNLNPPKLPACPTCGDTVQNPHGHKLTPHPPDGIGELETLLTVFAVKAQNTDLLNEPVVKHYLPQFQILIAVREQVARREELLELKEAVGYERDDVFGSGWGWFVNEAIAALNKEVGK